MPTHCLTVFQGSRHTTLNCQSELSILENLRNAGISSIHASNAESKPPVRYGSLPTAPSSRSIARSFWLAATRPMETVPLFCPRAAKWRF